MTSKETNQTTTQTQENSYLRTLIQNRALHKYFELVAKALNEAGLDIRATLKPDFEIDWSKESIKELIWKPAQKIYFGKESTTQLERKDIDIIYETINRFLAKHGIHVPFPSIEK